jgi:hypothetical protein
MKRLLSIALMILFAVSAKAQTGIPQSLSCTETAFNFSFSLGTKWKFSAPKIGPVNVGSYQPDFIPGLSAKIITIKPTYPSLQIFRFDSIAEHGYIPIKLDTLHYKIFQHI